MGLVGDIFGYPLRGGGKYIFFIGAALFVVVEWAAAAPVVGWLAALLVTAYISAMYFEIIQTTATGSDEAPDFPTVAGVMDDMILPMLKVWLVGLVSFGPVLAYAIIVGEDANPEMLFGLLGLGAVYFPMAMMAVAVLGHAGALSPHIVLPAIVRAGGIYWLAVFLICLLYLSERFIGELFEGIPIIGTVVRSLVAMYVLLTNGRSLGIIYRERREEMGWI
ncbi:hypothetical protein [Haloferula sp. A504]|uniref:hypothetical protein n=1 Tax=Haloferula sp. A504 TaxID=3373601 RepID=UPI0031BF705B|nr:hypothetical protein [Verrucomicrobiaceae bacterium E54]